jgi:CheY-like chemotaxis protein
MPRMDGICAVKEIRAIELHRNQTHSAQGDVAKPTCIFALTGLASSEDRENALKVGFDG